MLDPLQTIDFSKSSDKLVPAVIQDYTTQKILTLGFMDEKALKETQATGIVSFYSKGGRQKKKQLSDVHLKLRQILVDCDRNALLLKVETGGAVCDTGADTCWSEKNHSEDFLSYLEHIVHLRRNSMDETSYVRELFQRGSGEISAKLATAARELTDTAEDVNQPLFLDKAADLLFHYIVLLQAKNCTLADVIKVLQKRHQSK